METKIGRHSVFAPDGSLIGTLGQGSMQQTVAFADYVMTRRLDGSLSFAASGVVLASRSRRPSGHWSVWRPTVDTAAQIAAAAAADIDPEEW